MRRARVALVCAGLGFVNRGFERLARDLFELLRDDFDVTLFKGGGRRADGEVVLRVPRRNGPFRRLAGRDRALRLELAAFAARLLPHVRGGRFDVIHYVEPYLGNVLARARRTFGLDYTLLLTDGLGLSAASSRRADFLHVLTPGAYELAHDSERPRDRIFVIPAGITTDRFVRRVGKEDARRSLGLPTEGTVLLDVAALNRSHKRIDVLIEEVARLDGGELLVVDGAPEEPSLVDLGRERLDGRFRYLHVESERVPLLYAAADVFVHTALEEGFCLAAVEAMAAGLPVVMHRAPHFEWLVGDPRQLVDFRVAGALRAALASLPPDAAERNLRRAAELDWRHLRSQYVEMYDRVLAWGGAEATS